jgi:N-acetylglucosaminyldiphosphoundecaprenol N-acetyl-beta-D-mannosaminyltransferase
VVVTGAIDTLGRIRTYDVCGVSISALSADAASQMIVELARSKRSIEVHLCNAYTLSLVASDQPLREALAQSHLNLADGTPVAWFGRRHGVAGPVRGADLMPQVMRAGVMHGLRHYLYGGVEGVADRVAQRLAEIAPDASIVGCETPPFRRLTDAELPDLAARVSRSRADVVWLGIGTPQQDYLVRRLAPLVECVVVPVGAAFDFVAGRVGEAPEMFRGSGAEWVYRFAREPRRLWRRYLFGNPRFLVTALRHHRRQ